jgi:hypothetical protein
LDKYELVETLRAAADGIANATKSKEAELKLEDFRKLVYNFCKVAAVQAEFGIFNSSVISNEPLKNFVTCIKKFDEIDSNCRTLNKTREEADKLYKQLTNEDPPKED